MYQAEEHLGIVQAVLNKYYGGGHQVARFLGLDVEDLFQVGCIGLIRACNTYREDNSKGASFVTYAFLKIHSELSHFIRDDKYMMKFPKKVRELGAAASRVDNVTPHKLMEELRIPYQFAVDLFLYVKRQFVYHDQEVLLEDGDIGSSLLDVLPIEEPPQEMVLRQMDLMDRLAVLTERERTICVGLLQGKKQHQVAAEAGIHQGSVHRVRETAIDKIQMAFAEGG